MCLVDGARKEFEAYKEGLYIECTNRHTARDQLREGSRHAIAAALRPITRKPETFDIAADDKEDISKQSWLEVPWHDALMATSAADAVPSHG